MSRRTKGQDYAIGLLLVVGFVVWVLQQVWLYLLIGGATVLVGWLAVVITRKIQAMPPGPRLVTIPVSAPPEARLVERVVSPPESRPLLSIDPAVFEDAILAEGAALDVFKAWAKGLPMAPSDPTILVRDLKLHRRQMCRLESEIVTRELVWREEPHRARTGTVSPAPMDTSTDPWSRSAEEFKQDSQHLIPCTACEETGSVVCSSCDGRGQTQCPNCQGAGKAYGYAKNGSRRLMNCRACDTIGRVECSECESGKRKCASCQGSGRRRRWLEVVQRVRTDVRIRPENACPAGLSWSNQAQWVPLDQIKQDARVLGEKTAYAALSDTDVAQGVPAPWLVEHWPSLQPSLNLNERIQRQTLLFIEIPDVELTYSLPRGEPTTISLAGLRMLTPPRSVDTALGDRAKRLGLLRRVLMAVAFGVPITYLFRGRYFWSGWTLGLAATLIIVAAAMEQFLKGWTLGSPRSRRWALLAGSCALLVCGFAAGAEPSLRAAHRLLARGDLDAAKSELAALGHPDQPQHALAWADLHLALAIRSETAEGIRRELEQISTTLPQRRQAAQKLFDFAKGASRRHLAAGRWHEAEAVLAVSIPPLTGTPGSEPWLSELNELGALSQDQVFERCGNTACRLSAARRSAALAASRVRTERLAETRARAVEDLELRSEKPETTLAHLQRLAVIAANVKGLGDQPEDRDLAAKISAADELVRAERAKVPLLGADSAVLGQLLGADFDVGATTLHTVVAKVALFASIRSGHCVGIYMTGAECSGRALNDAARSGTAARLLSQAFGHGVALPDVPRDPSMKGITRDRVGRVPVVARWNGTHLMELRIGEAKP